MSRGIDFSRVSPQFSAVCKTSRKTFLRRFETAFMEDYTGDIVRAAAEDDDAEAGTTVVTYGVDRQTMLSGKRRGQFDYILTIRVANLPQGYCRVYASILWASFAPGDFSSSNPHGRILDLIAALIADLNNQSDGKSSSDTSDSHSTTDKDAPSESAQGDKRTREASDKEESERTTKDGALSSRTDAILKKNSHMRALSLVIVIAIAIAIAVMWGFYTSWQRQEQEMAAQRELQEQLMRR